MENKEFKILLVDDEPDILEFLGYNLTREGYQVFKAKDGTRAVEKAREILPHLVILDVMMPNMDGMEACNRIRKIPELADTLIAFLTARSEDYSQIAGFEVGADDYIAKPIKPKVFLSRVQALLRRHRSSGETEKAADRLLFGDLTIDRSRFLVIHHGKEIMLPKKEFELLFLLASNPGRMMTRKEIFDSVWGQDVVVGDRTIDVHIRRIREKLELDAIRTVKGVGYKFEER
jgi:two-component system alkaline phosphatase synthesis response regulator PhoP